MRAYPNVTRLAHGKFHQLFWSTHISLGDQNRDRRVPLVVLDQLPLQISIRISKKSLRRYWWIRPEASLASTRRARVTYFFAGNLALQDFSIAARKVPPALLLLLLYDSLSSSYSSSFSSSSGSTTLGGNFSWQCSERYGHANPLPF